jgi:hypothetical protein
MLCLSISIGESYFYSPWALNNCLLEVTGLNCIWESEMGRTFSAVSTPPLGASILTDRRVDNEFTQLMKGLQGERLRQAFKYLDSNQDGFITADQFKRIILVSIRFQYEHLY